MASSTDSAWAVVRAAALTRQRFRSGWSDCTARARAAWAVALGAGLGFVFLLTTALTLLGKHVSALGMDQWDATLLQRLEERNPISFQTAIWWESFGSSALVVPLVVSASLVAVWRARPLVALTLLASYLLHKPVLVWGWTLWDRARPDMIAGGIAAPQLHSYPSGHMIQTVAVYGLLTYLWIRASRSMVERCLAVLCLALLSAMVALARLRLGVHWPSDIVAGFVVGAAWLTVLILALRRSETLAGG